jgi:flavin reductase
MDQVSDPKVDPALFRTVMSRFATGVTVIAARTADRIHAMTANAFMSGSLAPPLAVVSIGKKARMHRYLSKAERFSINILSREQEPLSRHFAGQPIHGMKVAFEEVDDVPLLPGSLARIAARTIATCICGDHTLFIGRILHLDSREAEPLLYFDRRYVAIDHSQIEPPAEALYFW